MTERPGAWTAQDKKRDREIQRDLYLRTLQIRWATMTPRQRKRLARQDPLIAIAIRRLVEGGLIP